MDLQHRLQHVDTAFGEVFHTVMDARTVRSAVCCVLALACIVQTLLLVLFTVKHIQRQRALQLSYRELTLRAGHLLLTCADKSDDINTNEEEHERVAREVLPDPYLQHVIEEQEAMLERHCSNETKLCLPGPKGDNGPSGAKGVTGVPGTTGDPGPKGVQGTMGQKGRKGDAGHQGPRGAKGETGDRGPPGLKGHVGLQGDKGHVGVKGMRGADGAKGQAGAKGDLGAEGARGEPGVKGQQGSKGEPGPQGQRGAKGARGAKGMSGYVEGSNCSCFSKPKPLGPHDVNRQAFAGSDVILHCPIIGSPVPDFTWSRDTSLPTSAEIVGSQLILRGIQSSDFTQYTCTALNIMGSATVTIHLKQADLNCDFENPGHAFCAWSQGVRDDLTWHLGQGSTSTTSTGPQADHTFGTGQGHYAYLDSREGVGGDLADLESPHLHLGSSLCVRFWHTMYGADVQSLALMIRSSSGQDREVWRESGDQGQGWHKVKVSVTPDSSDQIQLVFRATRGQGQDGDVAIDDIVVTSGLCINPPENVNCDFEGALCGWENSGSWPWTLSSGTSGDPSMGLTVRNDSQHYVYVDPKVPGKVARLVSPPFDSSSPVCMQFFYNMADPGRGNLAVNVKRQDGGEQAWWQRASDPLGGGNQWRHVSLTIGQGSGLSRLVLEAKKGDSNQGNQASDIAFDDVNLTSGMCPEKGLGCGFEQVTLCTWSQSTNDDQDWDLQVASEGGQNGAPTRDHTLQTGQGHYVSVKRQAASGQGHATLVSQTLSRSVQYCLSLWYIIPTPTSGRLLIYREVFGTLSDKLRTISFSRGGNWQRTTLLVSHYWTDYSLAIRAETGKVRGLPLAVDDISLTAANVCQ